jgi:hypothetical protein
MNATDTPNAESPTETKKAPKKVVKKAPTKKVAKVVKKPAAEKPAKKTASNGETTLADICKGLKMEPRTARRILRTNEVKNPGRWAWTTASDIVKIKKVLSATE